MSPQHNRNHGRRTITVFCPAAKYASKAATLVSSLPRLGRLTLVFVEAMFTLERTSLACQPCRNVLAARPCDESVKFTSDLEHHSSIKDLVHSFENGCPLCTRAWVDFHREYPDVTSAEAGLCTKGSWSQSSDARYNDSPIDQLRLSVVCYDTAHEPLRRVSLHQIEFQLHMAESLQLSSSEQRPRNTASIDASQWLHLCNTEHDCCTLLPRNFHRPPRLLHVVEDKVVLEDTDTLIPGGNVLKYATLSHCWGSEANRPLCLGPASEGTLKQGIAISDLPPTFEHAAEITRKLGLEWLWIDSLCIIQDGPDKHADWTRHVAQMGAIYAGAYVNIAASVSRNSLGGCFRERSLGLCQPIQGYVGDVPCVLVEQSREHIKDWVINCRAWVLQERLLSLRVLHYGATDVFFECPRLLASGNYPFGMPWIDRETLRANTGGSADQWTPFDWRQRDESKWKEPLLYRWRDICQWYSRCFITRAEDRLPALAGIAQAFNDDYAQGDYIAGYFATQLPRDLLWRLLPNGGRLKASEHYVAPSWSWMSVDGQIDFSGSGIVTANVLRLEQVLMDSMSPYGRLASASLYIEGWVGHRTDHKAFSKKRCYFSPLQYRETIPEVTTSLYWDIDQHPKALQFSNSLLCVTENEASPPVPMTIYGLILSTHDREGRCCSPAYSRVGYFKAISVPFDHRSADTNASGLTTDISVLISNRERIKLV